jgi:hypothetical protein
MTYSRLILGVALLGALCLRPPASVCQEKDRRPADPNASAFGTSSGQTGRWAYSMTGWEKGTLYVSVLRLGPPGQGLRPVLMTVSRQTFAAGSAGEGSVTDGTFNLSLAVGNGERVRLQFKEGDTDLSPEIEGKKYRLADGALFVIDYGARPARVQQVKADLGKFIKGGALGQANLEAALQGLRAASPAVDALLKKGG